MSKKTLKTVNVVKTVDGKMEGLEAFPDDREHIGIVEKAFVDCCSEDPKWGQLTADEIKGVLDDGYWEWNNIAIFLVHSTVLAKSSLLR